MASPLHGHRMCGHSPQARACSTFDLTSRRERKTGPDVSHLQSGKRVAEYMLPTPDRIEPRIEQVTKNHDGRMDVDQNIVART